jgi:ABC-type antimicrobial peptide transport system permease subunit
VIRSSVAPDALTKQVRVAVAALDPDLPVSNAGSVQAFLQRAAANNDLIVVNFGISAGMGLLIAAVGLFGVISQLTQQRTRDIGIRMALGARNTDIVRMILRQGLRLLLTGVVLGIPGYFVLTRIVQRVLPEMALPGLWLLLVNLVVLGATMLLACYLPARRAAKVDPMIALRAE